MPPAYTTTSDFIEYRCTTNGHNKFWRIRQIHQEGVSRFGYLTEYGKIGSGGASTEKWFYTEWQRNSEYNKKIQEKLGKGYERYNRRPILVPQAGEDINGKPVKKAGKPIETPKKPEEPKKNTLGADTRARLIDLD